MTGVCALGATDALSPRAVARLVDRSHSQVKWLAARGDLVGVKVDGRWRFTPVEVDAYLERRRWAEANNQVGWRRLPSEPLLTQIRLHGGRRACGVQKNSSECQALNYALWQGWVTERQADRLCTLLLGMTPAEVWGEVYWALAR